MPNGISYSDAQRAYFRRLYARSTINRLTSGKYRGLSNEMKKDLKDARQIEADSDDLLAKYFARRKPNNTDAQLQEETNNEDRNPTDVGNGRDDNSRTGADADQQEGPQHGCFGADD